MNHSIKKLVYDELKKSIISMKFAPGQMISTKDIAARLNVSATPVREAFLQLQSEGLLEMIPQKETIVSKINLDQIEQEKFIRECLEAGVIDIFIKKQTEEDIKKMSRLIREQEDCIGKKDYVGFVYADDRFHKVLFDVASRQMAWDTIASRNGHYNRYRILIVQNESIASGSIEQHEQIVKLLSEGKEDMVRQLLKEHIRRLDLDNAELDEAYSEYFDNRAYGKSEFRIGTL